MNKYILEIAIFICGAVVMVFELVGSRILGPYLGTSIFVWTSLIGIILGSLSFGYYIGGKVADKKPSFIKLSLIVLSAAIFISLTMIVKDLLLMVLQSGISEIRIKAVIASLVLFAPTSVALGIVSPYAVKLKLNNLNTSGSTVGNLYAISTAGSIFGTFLSGFYLIPYFGTNKLLIILSVLLVIVSLLLAAKNFFVMKLSIFMFMILSWFAFGNTNYFFRDRFFVDVDTPYNRVWIYDQTTKINDTVRTFLINNERSSAMFLDKDDLVYEYTKYYHLAKYFFPDFKKTLMLGGAGYSYPKDFLLQYPNATIDVVEIDPKITDLAKKYFNLKDDPRLNIYHEDGRVFLNRTQNKYDVIFGDAFSSQYSLPYQLTTTEAVQKKFNILSDNGVVILNIISAIEGEKGEFLRAEYATYKNVFPQVYLFPVSKPEKGDAVQNIILVAIKSDKKPDFKSYDIALNKYLKHLWKGTVESDLPILTDDFAPVDYYISKTI